MARTSNALLLLLVLLLLGMCTTMHAATLSPCPRGDTDRDGVPDCRDACPGYDDAQWLSLGPGMPCIKTFGTHSTWDDARTACEALTGGELASVHDWETGQLLLQQWAPPDSGYYTWIGATDVAVEGTFVWSDGTPFDYTNWAGGEPNNDQGNEHCIMANIAAEWVDAPCSQTRDYTCTVAYVAYPGTDTDSDFVQDHCDLCPGVDDSVWTRMTGADRCWAIYEDAGINYADAEAACNAAAPGGHLVRFDSQAEEYHVQVAFGSATDFYIGANDIAAENTFVYTDGTPVSYTNWGPSQPDNWNGGADGAENCVTSTGAYLTEPTERSLHGGVGYWTYGTWNDLGCSELKTRYVCQYEYAYVDTDGDGFEDGVCDQCIGIMDSDVNTEEGLPDIVDVPFNRRYWEVMDDGARCIARMTSTGSYTYLANQCVTEGGVPVRVANDADNAHVLAMATAWDDPTGVWIGLTDAAVEGTFVWADGETDITYANTKWRTNEPNNDGDEDCVNVWTDDGTWNDAACGTGAFHLVCQKELDHGPVSYSFKFGDVDNVNLNTKYLADEVSLTAVAGSAFTETDATCPAGGADAACLLLAAATTVRLTASNPNNWVLAANSALTFDYTTAAVDASYEFFSDNACTVSLATGVLPNGADQPALINAGGINVLCIEFTSGSLALALDSITANGGSVCYDPHFMPLDGSRNMYTPTGISGQYYSIISHPDDIQVNTLWTAFLDHPIHAEATWNTEVGVKYRYGDEEQDEVLVRASPQHDTLAVEVNGRALAPLSDAMVFGTGSSRITLSWLNAETLVVTSPVYRVLIESYPGIDNKHPIVNVLAFVTDAKAALAGHGVLGQTAQNGYPLHVDSDGYGGEQSAEYLCARYIEGYHAMGEAALELYSVSSLFASDSHFSR